MSSIIQNYNFLNDIFSRNVTNSLADNNSSRIEKIEEFAQKEFCLFGIENHYCKKFPNSSSAKADFLMPSFASLDPQINAYRDMVENTIPSTYKVNRTHFPVSYYRHLIPGHVFLGKEGHEVASVDTDLKSLKNMVQTANNETMDETSLAHRQRKVTHINQFFAVRCFESEVLQNPYFFEFEEEKISQFLKKISYIFAKNDEKNRYPREFRYKHCESENFYTRLMTIPKPTPPKKIEKRMIEFIKKMKIFSKQNIPPLAFGAWAHSEILRIFPFCGGNGKVARLLMNTILIRFGGQAPLMIPNHLGYDYAITGNFLVPGIFTKYLNDAVIPWNRGKEDFYLEKLEWVAKNDTSMV